MEIKLEHFLQDLVWLIKEDYNESLDRAVAAKSETEKAREEGQSMAYFHVLSAIASQLYAFGAGEEMYKGIEPKLGEKAELKKARI